MTGLEKIISQIKAESDAAAAQVINKAKAEADQIISEAREAAKTECASIEKHSEASAANILARAKSAADLKKRQAILAKKQELISGTIVKSKQHLYDLPDKEYFDIILKMAEKFALPQKGIILFSAKDLSRLPADFDRALESALKQKGAALAVSRETREIDGGFVLSYGGIEENCSFNALFDSAHELLQDKVQEVLFA